MTDTNISGQGYLYGSEPKATNPFYNKDDTGGGSAPDKYVKSARIVQGESTDAVKLETVTVENGTETTANSTEWNVQGRQGEKGEQGEPGSKGDTGEPGKAATVTVGTTTTGEPGTDASVANSGTESDAVLDFTIPKGEKGDKGDPGADGAPGAKGDPGDPVSKAGLMTDVSMTNENGIYTFKQTKYDDTGTATAETEIGTVEVPTASAGIVEVKDSVVENNTKGYDFHTITETENDGTENEVGKFYIAQKQVIFGDDLNSGSYTVVDQAGNESTIYRYKQQYYMSSTAVEHTFNAEAKFLRFSFDVTYGHNKHTTSAIFPNVDPSTLKDNDILLAAPFMCTGNYAPAVEALIFPFVIVTISKGRFTGKLWPHLSAYDYSITFNSFTVEDIL